MWVDVLRSKFFILMGSVCLLLLLVFLGKELQKKLEIRREILELHQEIVSLEGENKGILELINYLKTTEYKERQARSLLNLQKPGEFAVALPPAESEEETSPAGNFTKARGKENLQRWWDYYFGPRI